MISVVVAFQDASTWTGIIAHVGHQFSSKDDLKLTSSVTDSKEKPFSCSACGKSYARRDVFHRHLRTHSPSLELPPMKRRNVLTACDSCHNRKVKCHPSERPCPRCKLAGLVCNVTQKQASSTESGIIPSESTPSSYMEQDPSPLVIGNETQNTLFVRCS